MGGGQGGSEAGDGVSALLWPTSAANTSVELFEQRVPVLVTEKAYVPDSGGPGRHRGGLGQRVSVRKLDGDGLPTLASVYPEGVGIEVPGLFGGKPGPLRARRRARRVRRDHHGLRHRAARLDHDRSGDRRGVPLGRLRLRLAVRAPARGDRARSRRRLRHAGSRRARLRRGDRRRTASSTWRKARSGASRARRRSNAAERASAPSFSHRLGDRAGRAAVHPVLHPAVRRHGDAELALRQSGEQSERHLHVAPLQSPVRQRPLFRRAGRDHAHRRDHHR